MADQWDAFPDAGTTATADDPFSKFPDVEKPKAAGSLTDSISGLFGEGFDTSQPGYQAPDWLRKTANALGKTAKGFIEPILPTISGGVPMLNPEGIGSLATPVVGAVEELRKTGAILNDVAGGDSIEEATRKHAPETFMLADAEKTPAGSQARYDAGIETVAQMLMAAGISRGLASHGAPVAEPTTLSEKLAPVLGDTTAAEPVPEVSTPVAPTESPASAPAPESVIAPASPETTAAPITPEGTRIEGPALVDPDGNVIIQGKLGETHADLLKQASEGPDAEKALAAFENDAQHVFVDDQGNVLNREQAAPIGVKAGQLPEGTTKVESQMLKDEPAPVQSFVTSKGSEYTVHEDGTTTRNKSVHPEHPGDEGVKPRSSETFYVTPEQALQLAEVQAQGQKTRLAKTADGEWGMQYTEGPNSGKFERRTVTRPSLKPAVGLQPVEVWYGQNKPHFGNEITEVKTGATETTSAAEPAPDQSTTGIAQRVNEARTEAGRTGEIQPGEGVSAEEMVNRGRELLKGGADPEAIIAGVSEGKAVTGDEMAVLRARREELSRVSDQAADDLRKNPNDPVLKQAADDAFKSETDFAQRIKPAATEWHKVGEAMQGETAVETGTFTGLRRAFVERTGRDVTPKESVTLEKTAERVKKANTEVDQATSAFSDVVKKETETTLPKSAEELRNHFAEKFKKMLIC